MFENYRELGMAVIRAVCSDYFKCLLKMEKYKKGGKKLLELYELCGELDFDAPEEVRKSALKKLDTRVSRYELIEHSKKDSEDFFLKGDCDFWSFDTLCGEYLMKVIQKKVASGARKLIGNHR